MADTAPSLLRDPTPLAGNERGSLAGRPLVIATHNPGKLKEIAALFDPHPATRPAPILAAGALGLPEPEETGQTFMENACLKARLAAAATLGHEGLPPAGAPTLADDSGLAVEALDGAPGIYSARWAGPEKDFAAAMERLRQALAAACTATTPPRASFICVLALAWPDGRCHGFSGRVDGTLVWPPRGEKGFGYDPIFVPDGRTLTFGEMAAADKHAISHRADAFGKFATAYLSA